jgi:hypothetical protein
MQKKIAFVHHPYFPKHRRLATMPFVMNILDRLAGLGLPIDLYLWEDRGNPFSSTPHENIAVKYKSALIQRHIFNAAELAIEFLPRTKYACAFGVGQPGSSIAGLISFSSSCPLMIINDEFPSACPKSLAFPMLERWAARRCDSIILPSHGRVEPLCNELSVEVKSHLVFPNITKATSTNFEAQDWRKILGIPDSKAIFLCAGHLSDWAQVPELLVSVAYWPDDAVLVMNSKDKRGGPYRRQLSHLELPGRVFWTDGELSEPQLNSLTARCAASFALYRNDGVNTETIGTASGKLMRSVAFGTPVIASSFRSLSFVTQEEIGVQVNHPSEIPAAVAKITEKTDHYRANCLAFAHTQYEAEEKAWQELVEILRRRSVLQ